MESTDGAGTFRVSGDAYDRFMGRYSNLLSEAFADAVGVVAGQRVLDVGCGPGALTRVLIDRLGIDAVAGIDPSGTFVEACVVRFAGVDVRAGRAEAIPFGDDEFDVVMSQLVFHFVSDPTGSIQEFRRVLRPGGVAAACVWDLAGGMEMLRHFWDAAVAIDPDAPDEARLLRFGGEGEIAALLAENGFSEVVESTLTVSSSYENFDELWAGFLEGIGPAGTYCKGLSETDRGRLRDDLYQRIGAPAGSFTLGATARCAVGRSPG